MWLAFILLSAVLLAAWILMVRRDVQHEHKTQVLAIYPLGMALLVPFMAMAAGSPIDFSILFTRTGALLLLKAMIVGLSQFCTLWGLKYLPLTIAGPVRNLNPLFVAILSFLLLGEELSGINLIGLVVIVISIMMLDIDIRHPKQLEEFKSHMKSPAALLVLLGAFIIAFVPPLDRVLLMRTDAFTIMFWYPLFLAIIFWVAHIVRERELPTKSISLHETLWLLLTGVVLLMADTAYLFALMFPAVMVAVVIGIRRLSNLFITIFGGAILHEKDGAYKAVVCAVMIIGTVLLIV